jgi:hypothetical protein
MEDNKPNWLIAAEIEAEIAADRARQAVLTRAANKAAADEAYRKKVRDIDKLTFKNQEIRDRLGKQLIAYINAGVYSEEAFEPVEKISLELINACSHDMVIEQYIEEGLYDDTWEGLYDDTCDPPIYRDFYTRKCVECFLEEEMYGYGDDEYCDLQSSEVIVAVKMVDGKEREMNLYDLHTWFEEKYR